MADTAYATAGEYRSAIGKDDVSDDREIRLDLLAVRRYLDLKIGRPFTQSTGPRSYYGKGTRELFIDDIVSVTSIVSDENADGVAETTWVPTDYQLRPLDTDRRAEPWPYTDIFLPVWSRRWFASTQLVTVTGTWGWPAVPTPVARANIQLTAILRMEGPRAARTLTTEGEILEPNPQAQNIVRELVDQYKKVSF